MGRNTDNEAEIARSRHKIDTIKKIRGDTHDYDRKTPKTEDEIAHEEHAMEKLYDELTNHRDAWDNDRR